MKVWKFPLFYGNITVVAPITKWLTAQLQNNTVQGWAEVNTDLPAKKFRIHCVGTGWDYPYLEDNNKEYIGTIQTDDGDVFHYYAEDLGYE